jgi:hypothetical protein
VMAFPNHFIRGRVLINGVSLLETELSNG